MQLAYVSLAPSVRLTNELIEEELGSSALERFVACQYKCECMYVRYSQLCVW